MTKSLSIGLAALMAMTAPSGAVPLVARDIGAGKGVQLAGAPVPEPHPMRESAPALPAAVSVATNTAPSGVYAGGVPFPPQRPGPARPQIVGRIQDGEIVPLTPNAFAERTEGPIATLFEAAESAADGSVPVPDVAEVEPAAPPVVLASVPPATSPLAGLGRADPRAFASYGTRASSLKTALDAVKRDDYKAAIALRNGLSDPLDRMIVDYFVVRAYPPELTFSMVSDFAARARGFPSEQMVRERAEATLARETPSADRAIAALGGRAETVVGARLLAQSYLAKGDKTRASAIVRGVWYNEAMGTGLQQSFASDFSSILTAEDHLIRAEMLVGDGRLSEAQALRTRLGSDPRAFVDALIAAASGTSDAKRKLAAVPSAMRRRPGYKLAEAEIERRADNIEQAAKLLESVNPKAVVNGDAWWVESRIVARSLAEKGDWRRAYKLAAKGFAQDREEQAEEAFHAGWFALVGMKDPATAERHFAALDQIATTPITSARAAYWRGRAAAARGQKASANQYYGKAAEFGFTYYGQLARTELGRNGTGVGRSPQPTAADRAAIRKNPAAQAITRMRAAGHEHRIWPFLDYLAETVPTAGQAVLVADMGEEAGSPHLALMVAKEAQRRGLPVGLLAYPTKHIPKTAQVPAGLDKAVVFAIARQESMFNSGARSPVGAAGLMQVMPRTASSMARELGLKHSDSRLVSDPAYNATLGAAYLKKRLGNFDGSYILTFAAYNAGAGRVSEWIGRFGDPRRPDVDPLMWVEQIPYPETRNYVQRVMENVQIYREALGTGHLAITSDLQRGRTS